MTDILTKLDARACLTVSQSSPASTRGLNEIAAMLITILASILTAVLAALTAASYYNL